MDMKKRYFIGLLTAMVTVGAYAKEAKVKEVTMDASNTKTIYVEFNTNYGKFVLELYPNAAPKTVENFVSYVIDGHFDETIFHRVIPNFMIQGGGFTNDMTQKETRASIKNEADNGLKNNKYAVAMARTQDPNSASSQFFINTKDNDFLNFTGKNTREWGYCVFGKVVTGFKTVDEIEQVRTTRSGHYSDVPAKPVIITKAKVIEKPADLTEAK